MILHRMILHPPRRPRKRKKRARRSPTPPALSTPGAAAVLASRFNEDGHRLLDCETQSTPPTTAAAVRFTGRRR